MDEIDGKIDALKKACRCLYIEVHKDIEDDVKRRANAVIDELKKCREENKVLLIVQNEATKKWADAYSGNKQIIQRTKDAIWDKMLNGDIRWFEQENGKFCGYLDMDSIEQAIQNAEIKGELNE